MVNDLEFGLRTILRCLYNMQTNFWKMSFHSGSKQNMANGDYNSNPSRNLNFDEAQANNTIVSKKDVCGFEQISDNLLFQIQDRRSKR